MREFTTYKNRFGLKMGWDRKLSKKEKDILFKNPWCMFKKMAVLLLGFLLCYSVSYGAITKTVATVDNWTQIATNTTATGAVMNVSLNYQTLVTVEAALISTTATTNGCNIVVLGSNSITDDNNWYPIANFNVLAGITAVKQLSNLSANAGNTTIVMSNTTGIKTKGMLFFINDSTQANSEIRYLQNQVENASITVDALTYTHANATEIWCANSTASQIIAVPDSTYRVKVFYNNAADTAGSAVVVRSSTSQLTGI
jgi:hypothetical protein